MKKKGREQLNVEMSTEEFNAMKAHAVSRDKYQVRFIRRAIRETMARDLEAENPPMPELREDSI